jgi:hypothetical protein
MATILVIGKILLLSWFITRFEPVQWIVDILFEGKQDLTSKMLQLTLTCSKCLSFWLGVIISQDIFLAIIGCFLMVIYEKTIGKWEQRIEF